MKYDFNPTKIKIKETEEWLKNEYLSIRTGRATPFLLDGVEVKSYGGRTPLKQLAAITTEDARTLRITPWDKSQVKEIESAINLANLGVSISGDQQGIRIVFPELTAESRERIIKVVKTKFEEARISIRQIRDKFWGDIQSKEREGKLSEDDKFRGKDDLQKLVDEANKNLEVIMEKKEKEIAG